MLKKIIIILICTSCTGIALAKTAKTTNTDTQEESLNRTVAIVGKRIVTQSDLDQAIATAKQQNPQLETTFSDAEIKKHILEVLVDQKILLAYAEQTGQTATDEQVNATIKALADKQHWTVDEFKKQFEQQKDISYDTYINSLRDQLTVQGILYRTGAKIKVTPADIAQFRKENQDKLPIQYRIASIRIPFSADDTSNPTDSEIQAAKQKANAVENQIQKGESFDKAMKEYDGDNLGWRTDEELPDVFEKVVPTLQVNQISKPIQAENGFHIVKLLDKRDSVTNEQIETEIKAQKSQKELEKIVKNFKKQIYIKVYAG